jgi:hypothetical protein
VQISRGRRQVCAAFAMRATALTRIGRNQHQPSHRRGWAGQGRCRHWNRVFGSHDMPALQVFANVSRTRVLGVIEFSSLRCRNIVLRCQGDLTIDDHHTTGAHYSLWNPLCRAHRSQMSSLLVFAFNTPLPQLVTLVCRRRRDIAGPRVRNRTRRPQRHHPIWFRVCAAG